MNLFEKFFTALNVSGISYAITGRTENYPEIILGDIDIVITKNEMHKFWFFLKKIADQKMNWVQIISHEITAHYCIITISDGSKHHILKPDVCSDYFRNGVLFLDADYLLDNKVYNRKGFYELAPEKEFIYYLIKKIDKENIDEEQFKHLRDQWLKVPSICRETLKAFFSEKNIIFITESISLNLFAEFKNEIPRLKRNIHQNLKFSLRHFLLKKYNRLNRLLKPTGLIVAFMGPDGCGKTTVINGVKNDLNEIFRQTYQYHLYPKKGKEPSTNPHLEKPRGNIGSLLKLIYFLSIYVFGYIKKVFPKKVKSTLIIFDRYYHDLFVDPYRYRHGAGMRWIRYVGYFIPKPDLWILLDARAEVVQKRKTEVPAFETERQLTAYRELFKNLDNAFIVDANQPIENVIYDSQSIVIDYLNERNKRRQDRF